MIETYGVAEVRMVVDPMLIFDAVRLDLCEGN